MKELVSEFIADRLNTAHGLIDEGRFDVAVNLLKNIKLRIHEKEAEDEINKFEKEHDARLEISLKEIESSNDDPLRKDANIMGKWESYSKDYLNFYDGLSQKLL